MKYYMHMTNFIKKTKQSIMNTIKMPLDVVIGTQALVKIALTSKVINAEITRIRMLLSHDPKYSETMGMIGNKMTEKSKTLDDAYKVKNSMAAVTHVDELDTITPDETGANHDMKDYKSTDFVVRTLLVAVVFAVLAYFWPFTMLFLCGPSMLYTYAFPLEVIGYTTVTRWGVLLGEVPRPIYGTVTTAVKWLLRATNVIWWVALLGLAVWTLSKVYEKYT